MSLDPSPLSPTPTPLLSPTDPVPGRGAAAMGAGISVVLAILVAFISMHFGTQLLYLPQGIKAHTTAWTVTRPFQIQGFNYQWARSYSNNSTVGYASASTNDKIFSSEAKDLHMNLVVITITADQPSNLSTTITFGPNAADGYSDDVYTNAAKVAVHYGLTPVFKLEIRTGGSDPWSGTIGSDWAQTDKTSVENELKWFNSYTAFAAHYAALAHSLNMPFFIIGSELDHLTVDTPQTGAGAPGPSDPLTPKCSGRRDCEWRHVINAIHQPLYDPFQSASPVLGGTYSGKLIYAATSRIDVKTIPESEWQNIPWWDAIDYIGIDAFFPLSNTQDPTFNCIQDAWMGKTTHCGAATYSQGDVFDKMAALSGKFGRPIIFTGVGYESVSSANSAPGTAITTNDPDQNEQVDDMQGLLQTFQSQAWWLGAIWSYDYAVWPRATLSHIVETGGSSASPFDLDIGGSESDWTTNTEWAGSCLKATTANGNCPDGNPPDKQAGKWLNTFYQVKPIPPLSAIA